MIVILCWREKKRRNKSLCPCLTEYTVINENCPGAEWNIMCRGCCEYDQIRCKCPNQGDVIGYAVPCCRNEANECDPCIIHPGCSIFENCKRCNNGTWGVQDDFFIKGKYCSECRTGWSGGDCMKCGGVINAKRGYIAIESYPTNAHCEWTLNVNPQFTIELRFSMLSLEFDYSCRYDYVEVRDGDNVDAQVIGRFCGNERPPPIRSTGHSLHVLFVSDGYKSFDGFHLSFAESSACLSSPCLHDGTCLLDATRSFRCACLAGYTGKQCENCELCASLLLSPLNSSSCHTNVTRGFGGLQYTEKTFKDRTHCVKPVFKINKKKQTQRNAIWGSHTTKSGHNGAKEKQSKVTVLNESSDEQRSGLLRRWSENEE
uniref:Inactive serine protease PAMR1-like n=1 Tax=Erpetoichthys calabaricus TaxID=27687 RepID=A0A8C4TGN7_ERPCA